MGISTCVAVSSPYVEAQSMIGSRCMKRDVYSWHKVNEPLHYWNGYLKTPVFAHVMPCEYVCDACDTITLHCICIYCALMLVSYCARFTSGSMSDTFMIDWRWRLRRRPNWSRVWAAEWRRYYWWNSVTGVSQWSVPLQWVEVPIPQRWCSDCQDWHDSD